MQNLDIISAPVKEEMERFRSYMRQSMKSDQKLMDIVMNYIIKTKGKQLRPLFVFLSARMHGEINDKSYTAATLIELLHTATLVHDDVVDDSLERRNFFSVKALWRSKLAVLAGDYLLAQGLLISLKTKHYDLLETVSQAVKEMSEGELLQYQTSRKRNIDEEKYYEIIHKKTATLIAACTQCGTISTCPDNYVVKKMQDFGMNAGMAFQIRDDLFDFMPDSNSGKPKGNDLKEKKFTLPIIYSLNHLEKAKAKKLRSLMENKSVKKEDIEILFELITEGGGLEYSKIKMEEYISKSLQILHEFPESPSSQSLENLIHYIIERKS
jgi:octaprenyl-diphosphate synthase